MGASLVQTASAVFADSAASQTVVFGAGTTAGTNVIVCVDGADGTSVSSIDTSVMKLPFPFLSSTWR